MLYPDLKWEPSMLPYCGKDPGINDANLGIVGKRHTVSLFAVPDGI